MTPETAPNGDQDRVTDSAALDMDAIEAKWLQMCGYCDAGMQTACRCPDEDHRTVISDLVAEIRRLRNAV